MVSVTLELAPMLVEPRMVPECSGGLAPSRRLLIDDLVANSWRSSEGSAAARYSGDPPREDMKSVLHDRLPVINLQASPLVCTALASWPRK